ncbi:DUF6777 domain-containing protein [Streptomyces cyaneus]|uniref:DUF6777 domain-containing protein n=1 Tax=Streptomyces cyaneus TaxID=1904 RepID=UPI000FF888CA|nr:DUF6777 domain-containing protein [Streptomyces cyaneus]
MSVEPPSSGRPTGPPSGPLSGPSGPPSQPPDDGGPGGPWPEPQQPWWRSVPRLAALTAVVVAAVVLAVVFSRGGGDSSPVASGEVFHEGKDKQGPAPFTESTANNNSVAPVTPTPAGESASTNAVRRVDGGAPGLYGGTRNVASCDVEKQIDYLRADPEKNRAFASVAQVDVSEVPSYLRSLTPVQLRMDTRVTNHGFRDGAATTYQAVLQAGTAVLVDEHGVPRVRCACGNPLTDPVAQQGSFKRTGDSWPSYSPSNVVVVSPSTTIVNIFVIFDVERDEWIARQRGDDVDKDKKTHPPARPSPSVSVSTPTSSPSKCVPLPDDATEMPPGSVSPCPPTSTAPSSPSTSPETSTSEPTTTKPETSKSSETSESPETSASTSQPPSDGDTTATSQSASTGSGSGSVSGSPPL